MTQPASSPLPDPVQIQRDKRKSIILGFTAIAIAVGSVGAFYVKNKDKPLPPGPAQRVEKPYYQPAPL